MPNKQLSVLAVLTAILVAMLVLNEYGWFQVSEFLTTQ